MPQYKKSQVAVIVIIAILIVSSIGVFIISRTKIDDFKEKDIINPNIVPIYSFLEDCIIKTGYDGVSYLSHTGGYYNIPELSTDESIAYYFYEGQNKMPKKEKIESELSDYIKASLFMCHQNFETLPAYKITEGEMDVDTNIQKDKITFNVKYPLTIVKEEKTYYLEDFRDISISLRLGEIYEVVDKIMQEQMFDKESICIGCINELANEKELFVDLREYPDNTVVFTITDTKSKIGKDDLTFNFANKY